MIENCERVSTMSGLPKYLRDKTGSFSLATALMILPALTGVMVAFDYSRFDQLKEQLRDAVEIAGPLTLMALPTGQMDEAGIDAFAKQNVLAKLGSKYAEVLNVHVELIRNETGKVQTARLITSLQYSPFTGPLLAVFEGKSLKDYAWIARTP